MKYIGTAALALAVFATASTPAFAADSMHSSMMMPSMPTCKAGDPVVAVNTQTKTYETQARANAKMAGMSQAQVHTAMMQHHYQWMCKSKADSMGAKMMTSSTMKSHM
jgi:hypothetical protein